jgi:hypothetical protein
VRRFAALHVVFASEFTLARGKTFSGIIVKCEVLPGSFFSGFHCRGFEISSAMPFFSLETVEDNILNNLQRSQSQSSCICGLH